MSTLHPKNKPLRSCQVRRSSRCLASLHNDFAFQLRRARRPQHLRRSRTAAATTPEKRLVLSLKPNGGCLDALPAGPAVSCKRLLCGAPVPATQGTNVALPLSNRLPGSPSRPIQR
jgi:hypothetical protein